MCLVGHITPCPGAQRLGGYNLKTKEWGVLRSWSPRHLHPSPRAHSSSTWGLFISQSVMGGPGPPQYR